MVSVTPGGGGRLTLRGHEQVDALQYVQEELVTAVFNALSTPADLPRHLAGDLRLLLLRLGNTTDKPVRNQSINQLSYLSFTHTHLRDAAVIQVRTHSNRKRERKTFHYKVNKVFIILFLLSLSLSRIPLSISSVYLTYFSCFLRERQRDTDRQRGRETFLSFNLPLPPLSYSFYILSLFLLSSFSSFLIY